ncbi:thiol-disulfide oxidoreductase DCC family protein [Macrococcus brunensis]|uniref:thiol-disulfide oxidoreductase DCC family protein n=1 Tax=Macrococcus brunensis TaxID=198483 RepID=UPI001EF0BE73|nr:DCC1-like thiol-disulfide oxidoreductase family protein [Macrococcus brunensis]ULG71232.1 DCC1-like thiol-disulfide oxidoreductase family protein [Macrococcus brunensis]
MNIIYFDDQCLICNRFVKIISTLDVEDKLYFAALHSKIADQKLAHRFDAVDSVIYLRDREVYIYSDAVIAILKDLHINVTLLKLIPLNIRNSLYQYVAKKRYLFRRNYCEIPDARLKMKILK